MVNDSIGVCSHCGDIARLVYFDGKDVCLSCWMFLTEGE